MKIMCSPGYHHNGFAALMHSCTLWQLIHHVPKCMSCRKAIMVVTGRAHCFHDCI